MTTIAHPPLSFRDRARGSFLGLALGDLYGEPLEFNRGDSVYTHRVDPTASTAHWTDDTHMALYVADAILDMPDDYTDEAFGHAVGRRFSEWLDDPLMPSTAPGNTCLAGARSYRRTHDWTTSGVRRSDGCGAVMRVAALPIVWTGATLTQAARVQAIVTHGHPNAPASAQVLCWIQREVLETGCITPVMVRRIIQRSREADHPAAVVEALEAAVALSNTHDWDLPLPEQHVPPGDGGWRSPSAVGLAVLANLQGTAFDKVVERAARIRGDSDSVAAIAGMIAGARWPRGIPADWLATLPRRDAIERLVDRLCGPSTDPRRVRRSLDDPLRVAQVTPYIGVTLAPGKTGPSINGYRWERDLDLDLGAIVHSGARMLICLLEDHELEDRGITDLPARAAAKGLVFRRFPVPDLGPPTLEQMREIVHTARHSKVVFHCMGGLGRAGTVAACLLIAQGVEADEAIRQVRRARPGAIQTRSQEAFIHQFTPGELPYTRVINRHAQPAYAGAVVFDGDQVLLRRLDAHGYVWTFPRRRVHADAYQEALLLAIDVAARAVTIKAMRPIPGTWTGDVSLGQYWIIEGEARTRLVDLPDPTEQARKAFGADPTAEQVHRVATLAAAGLPIHAVGVPLPLSAEHRALVEGMAAFLPEPAEQPPPLNLEWVPAERVAEYLGQTRSVAGRERDLAVWERAQTLRHVPKPLMQDTLVSTTFQIVLDGQVHDIDEPTFFADTAPIPLPYYEDIESMTLPNGVHQTVHEAGGELRACTTCRHARRTLMSSQNNSEWCWGTRDKHDDRRSTSMALSLCPLWEPAFLLWGLRDDTPDEDR